MKELIKRLSGLTHIAPLASFRFIFGLILFAGVLRFAFKGWITDLYVTPTFSLRIMGLNLLSRWGKFR